MIQTYGGVMYMDFNQQLMEERGYGNYERIDAAYCPRCFSPMSKIPVIPG